jgi:hypothetical protein
VLRREPAKAASDMSDLTLPDPADPSLPPPAASLTQICIAPRRTQISKKRGDITARIAAEIMAPSPMAARPSPGMPAPCGAEPALAPPEAAPTPAHERRPADDLLAYWQGLRGGRRVAMLETLDRAAVAAAWPDSLMLALGGMGGPTVARLGDLSGDIDYTPMITDWLLSQGRRAAARGEAVDAVESFPVSEGLMRYRLLALPFAGRGGMIEHVLCHLCRAPQGDVHHERRGWFSA